MADLNFPTSPSVNDTYSFGGKTWTWTGSYWRLQQSGAINNIPIGNAVPAAGTFTTLSATGNIYGNAYNVTGVNRNQTFVQNTTPVGAIQGDVWINTNNGKQYSYFTDANGNQWAEMEAYQAYSSTVTIANVSQRVDSFTGDGSNVTFQLSTTPSSANVVTVNYQGATLLHESYTVSGANITFGSAPASGYKFDVITLVGGDSQSVPAAGNSGQIQINVNGIFGGSANLTFDTISNTLSTTTISATGNIYSGGAISATANITGGNVLTAGIISAAGNIAGNYFVGNGSQLTGVNAGASNVSIRAQAMTMSILLGG